MRMDAYGAGHGGGYGGPAGYGAGYADAEPSQQIMVRNVSFFLLSFVLGIKDADIAL